MPQELSIFNYSGIQIRTIEKDGQPWFVARDVASVLGYVKPENAIAQHCKAQVTTPKQGGGFHTIIPERDVYRLVMKSQLPSAEKFENWVVSEVLPTIRKTGSYGQLSIPQTLPEALRLAADLAEQNALLAPKAAIADRLTNCDGWLNLRDAAKALKMMERKFINWLLEHRWLYRDQKGKLRGRAEKTPTYINHKVTPIPVDGDEERVSLQPMVTPEGLAKLAGIFNVELQEIAQ